MRRPDCFLCGDLADRDGRVTLVSGLALTSDIAPLAPGHLLVHTEEHLGSFAGVDSNTLALWKTAILRVLAHAAPNGRPVLVLEHGTDGMGATEVGCTDHAHIHVIPVSLDPVGHPVTSAAQAIIRFGESAAGPTLRFEELGSLAGTSYFWLADRDLVLRTLVPRRVERQILRRVVAEALGLKHHQTWDLFDESGARETMASWRGFFEGVGDRAGSLG